MREKCFHIVVIGVIGITATGEKIINAQLTAHRRAALTVGFHANAAKYNSEKKGQLYKN